MATAAPAPVATTQAPPAGFGANGQPYGQVANSAPNTGNSFVGYTATAGAVAPTGGSGSSNANASSDEPTSEPAVMSTQSGTTALAKNVAQFNSTYNTMANTAGAPAAVPGQNGGQPAPAASTVSAANPSTNTSISSAAQAQGGITATEAAAANIDLSTYQYDPTSGYYLPSNGGTTIPGTESDAQFQDDKDAIDGAFGTAMAGLSSSESQIVGALQESYGSQIALQQNVNAGELAATSAMNAREGTSQYAPGVANSIFTAEETYGLQQVTSINAQMNSAIAEANDNLAKEDYQAFLDNQSQITTLTENRTSALQSLQTQDLAKQQFAEKEYTDAASIKESQYEFQPAYNAFGQQVGTTVYDKLAGATVTPTFVSSGAAASGISGPTVTLPTVPLNSDGTPNTQAQQSFLQTIPKAYQATVEGIADYSINPATLTAASKTALLSWAAQYDPTYDQASYAARADYLSNLQSGTMSQGVLSGNKAIAHISALATSLTALGNTNTGGLLGFINPLKNTVESTFSSVQQGKVSNANTVATGVKDELAKFFKGTGSSDVTSVEDWGNNINTDMSPADQKGSIQGALTLMSGQLSTMMAQYQSTMGKPAPLSTFLQPQTIATMSSLRNQGYDFGDLNSDVPYTDPVAFAKADPANATLMQNIQAAYPSLSPSQALQLAQYTPSQ